MTKLSIALACLLPSSLTAFAGPALIGPKTTTSTQGSELYSLKPLYDEVSQSVIQKLGLQRTDFTDSVNAASWTSGPSSGTAEWLAESNPQFLTGVSMLTRSNPFPTEELTINCWMGPSYDCPSMLLQFGQQSPDGVYYVKADYVPRGATCFGSDPQYVEQYYQRGTLATYQQAMSMGYPLPPESDFESRLLNSPTYINVGGMSPDAASQIVREHVQRFLGWLDEAQQVPARSRGSFNLRDDKLRQFYYRGQLQKQIRELGDGLGQAVAAANTGPTAEAYVGGGS